MLPKSQRLNRKEIEEVLKKGRTLASSFFRIKFLSGQTSFKIAPIVSKKVAKTAVERNVLRRAIYNVAGEFELTLTDKHMTVFAEKGATKELCETGLPLLFKKLK